MCKHFTTPLSHGYSESDDPNGSPMVSVIVPAYNARLYIRHCIKSITDQSYSHIEVILIDDGSTDGTDVICKTLEQRYDCVRVVCNDGNKGVEVSRFVGLENSRGEFVMFVDADDYLAKNAVELMVEAQRRTGADIVEGMIRRVVGCRGWLGRSGYGAERVITQPKLFDEYYYSFFGRNILSVNVWNKLYRRSLFRGDVLEPSGLRMGEDLLMNMRLFPSVRVWTTIPEVTYNYRYGGMTSRYNPTFYADQKTLYHIKMEALRKHDYLKAEKSVKIEMANVLHSALLQIVRFRYDGGLPAARRLLESEDDSGFISEITEGVDYSAPHFHLIRDRRFDELLALIQKEAGDRRMLRRVFRVIRPILNYL